MQFNKQAMEFSNLNDNSSSDEDDDFIKRMLSKPSNKDSQNSNSNSNQPQPPNREQMQLTGLGVQQQNGNQQGNQLKGLSVLKSMNRQSDSSIITEESQNSRMTSARNSTINNKSLLNKVKKSNKNQSDDEDNAMKSDDDSSSNKQGKDGFFNQFQMQSKQTPTKPFAQLNKKSNGAGIDIPHEQDDQLDQIPKFAQQKFCKDAKMNPPGHPDYDPTTLYIPQQEFNKLTNTKKQYWSIKAKHFDKIIFFKLGKFYEVFYEDSIVCAKILDLTFTNKQLHCGFPEKSLEKYASKLVQFGYKVVVVEQTSKKQNNSGIVDRDVTQIITKGTINFTFEEQNQDPKYLLIVRQRTNQEFGIVVYESFTSKIQVGLLQDDKTQTRLKTFLCVLKPSEIVYDPGNITSDILKILKSQFFASVMSPMRDNRDQWSTQLATFYLEKQFGTEIDKYPEELKDIRVNDESRGQVINLKFAALAGFYSYMDSTLQLENILNSSEYIKCDFDNKQFAERMILDSQALQHLEILENSQVAFTTAYSSVDYKKGTLLSYLDYTKTPYGKRMMKKWVCSPLVDISAINDRLDAIEDIQNNLAMKDKFQYGIARYADIERLCSSIYRYSVKQKHTEKAVMYENISGARLREFKSLINCMKEIEKLIEETFMANIDNIKSQRLKRIVSYKMKGDARATGDLPKVSSFIKVLESIINLDSNQRIGGKQVNQPVPKDGFCPEYDELKEQIRIKQEELDQYLERLKIQFNTKDIQFAFMNNRQYDIQVNKNLFNAKNKKPADFNLQSHTGNYQRFSSKFTSEKVSEIEQLEEQLKEQLANFCIIVFREFYKKKHVWDKFVSIVAELDCLVSLSHASFSMADNVMCRPVVKFAKTEKETFFYLKQGRNPNLIQLEVKQVPNDIILGNIPGMPPQPNIMILTGPNMGGKSTTLRLFCLSAILAQIGCYVPAQQCEFSLVDRIFTRIGAGDKLIEGKSTFYIEMEEVKNSLMYGTYNSIAIFDELGRGTSTFDGVAIAYGILKYYIEKIQSRCIFATHFFLLINELRFYKEISFYHMEYFYDKNSKKLIFKYRLKQGNAESSFGIDLAKIVGIEESILKKALQKQHEFENSLEYSEVEKQQTIKQFNGLISKLFTYENDRTK